MKASKSPPRLQSARALALRWLGLWLVTLSQALGYEALQGPTELLHWDKSKAFTGYTWFGVRGTTYLIDMEGRVAHTWPVGTNPHLLPGGSVLDASKDDPSGFGGFTEVDWSGRVVWQYTETRTNYAPHHDFLRIFNGRLNAPTTLYIANKSVSSNQCIAAGCNPAFARSYTNAQMDAVVEVDAAGKVVWEWWFFDHVVQDLDPSKPNHVGTGKTIADHPGRLNLNIPGLPVQRDWLHCNAIDYNAALDQIVLSSVRGEIYVIDHGGTFVAGNPAASIAAAAGSAGDFLYRFGDPARYAQGRSPYVMTNWTESAPGQKQIGGVHHVSWIPDGLAGAGHLLLFNNAQNLFEHSQGSYAFEIDAFLQSSGARSSTYVNPPDAGYDTSTPESPLSGHSTREVSRQIVWSYSARAPHSMFSHIGGSAQRLPNGNTLICADTEGHVVEVTASGEVAWEYINPVTSAGAVRFKRDDWPMGNSIFRAFRIAPDDPVLAGRALVGGNTITGRKPGYHSVP